MEKTYYIYHIPSVKIGVSVNPQKRVKAQGYSNYEILETHTDIIKVSEREQELQKQYGYIVDSAYYKESNKNLQYARTKIDPNHIQNLGKIEGKKRVESGHLSKLHKEFSQNGHWSKIGLISSKPKRKLSYDDAQTIRELYSLKKHNQYELAEMYNVSQGIITQIIRNKSYKQP